MWKLCTRVILCLLYRCCSASSNYNYNAYNYDMAPTFTPDGRLLQVEYASAAASLSTPIVAIQFDPETLVLIATKNPSTPQNRILVLSNGIANNNQLQRDNQDKGGTTSPWPIRGNSICIAMSGVLADSISLVQKVLGKAREHYQNFQAPMSVLQMATAIADECQLRSFGGGIRPYGSTMLICGFSPTGDSFPIAYQTDPSGAILEATSPALLLQRSGESASNAPKVRWISGGSSTLQRQLQKRLESKMAKQLADNEESVALVDVLALAAGSILKETQNHLSKSLLSNKSNGNENKGNIEVVILNHKLGCHRLTRDQVKMIEERI